MSAWRKLTIFTTDRFHASRGFHEIILSDYLEKFHLDAVDEDMHLSLAHQMYKSGNYKQALEHSNTVYERNPLRTDNLLLVGAIYYQVCSSIIVG